ncbi:hypothetical protein I314_01834 [Cryptococcus bacillisporus CA1873]|uniref:Uncharacterized protein n=1 Tax=Cryptococcus bacillisporus CA1873 TaxID=1296111 RepID=A0ABR5BHL4_CRYGA|nr:hypothetical protein I314_01834 [Cryptococcus bacillisporus CA1873]|eukprot:KIR68333.1 hypothetical protein I314_01834 [Cryptococcus gattii CA1873]
MSAPRVIAELVVTGIKVLGKATAAAGQQAIRKEWTISACLGHITTSVKGDAV